MAPLNDHRRIAAGLIVLSLALAGLVALAPGAQAQNPPTVHLHLWDEGPDDPSPDGVGHWNEMGTNPSGDQAIPARGLYPIRVDYTSESRTIDFVRFRFVDEDNANDWVRYDFRVSDERVPEDQRVHLASEIVVDRGSGPTEQNSICTNPPNPSNPCYFFIDTTKPPTQTSGALSSFDDTRTYTLDVTLMSGSDESDVGEHSNDPSLDPIPIQASLTTPQIDPSPPETRDSNELRFSVDITGSEADDDEQEFVDVWACLMFPDDPDNPRPKDDIAYRFYEPFQVSDPDLDIGTPECTDPRVPKSTSQAPGEQAWGVFVGDHATGQNNRDPDRRFHNFTIDQLRDEDGTSQFDENGDRQFTIDQAADTFYLRMIFRDEFGNHVVRNYHNSGPGVFTLQDFSVAEEPEEIEPSQVDDFVDEDDSIDDIQEGPTAQEFRDLDGCWQARDSSGNRHDNSEAHPCYRSIDYTPPNQAFEFPVVLQNHGNVDDTLNVTWDHVDGERQGWNVEIEDVDTGEMRETSLEVDVPAATASGPGERRIIVSITPASDAIADNNVPTEDPDNGFKKIRLTVTSEGTDSDPFLNDATFERVFLQAHLVKNRQGSISIGQDDADDHIGRITAEPQQEKTIPVTLENTGNARVEFRPELNSGHSAHDTECGDINTGTSPSEINIRLETSAGTQRRSQTLVPGETAEMRFRVEIGRNVEPRDTGVYECVFQARDDDGGPGISLTPTNPILEVDVVGTPDVQVWDLRGENREEVNVTGQRIVERVPPDADQHKVVLYLENTGTVDLQPELNGPDPSFRVLDEKNLGGTWFANLSDGTTPGIETTTSAFSLPVSDTDDADQIEIRNLFKEETTGSENPLQNPGTHPDQGDHRDDISRWWCAERHDPGDSEDTDGRVICRVEFTFRFADDDAVIGDHVVYNFQWADPSQEGETPGNVTLDLVFDHVGQVEARTVSPSVITDTGTSTVEFEALVEEGHRFDPGVNQIDDELVVTWEDDTCTEEVSSTFKNLTTARLRLDVTFDTNQPSPCAGLSDDGTLTIGTDDSSSGTAELRWRATDENNSRLRQVHPVHVRLAQNVDPAPQEADQVSILPSTEMQANGTQFAKLLFDDNGAFDSDNAPDIHDGVVLTRRAQTGSLESFTECALDGSGVRTTAGPSWTRIATEDRTSVPIDEGTDQILANEPITGRILEEDTSGDQDRARGIGHVTLYGWGDGSTIDWHEGWNPLVLRVTDDRGEPASPPGSSDAPDLELQFKLAVRNEDEEITHSYILDSEDDVIQLRNLGNGYVAADVYVPEGINDAIGSDDNLADHPHDSSDTSEVEYEAWAMHLEISNGESIRGNDISGDAYWQAADLGILTDDDTVDPDQGTVGANRIDPGGRATDREQRDTSADPDERQELIHAATRFLDGPGRALANGDDPWLTGPGVHDYGVFLYEETEDPHTSSQTIGEEESAADFTEHTFDTVTDASPSVLLIGEDRSNVRETRTVPLNQEADADGLYSGFFLLPDLGGSDFTWRMQLRVTDSDDTLVVRTLQRVLVDARLEAASSGLPMPLCLENSGVTGSDDPASTSDVFTEDATTGLTSLDLRAVPGMLPDRSTFSMVPALADGASVTMVLDADSAAGFHIEAPGLAGLDRSQLPTTGEEDVPITVTITPTGEVESASAELSLAGSTVDSTELDGPMSGGTWEGQVTPTDQGTHKLTVRLTDPSGTTTPVSVDVNVTENAPPRISFNEPSEQDGTRAMRSNGSVEATVEDRSIAASAINVSVSGDGGGGGGGADGSALASQDNITVTDLLDEVEPGTHTMTISVENDTISSDTTSGWHVWVNVTNSTDDIVDDWNASLDASGEASDSISLDETGTYTVNVQARNTTVHDDARYEADFTVDVVESGGGGGGSGSFSPVPSSDLSISCEGTSCDVTYTPSDVSHGDTFTVRVSADIGPDDQSEKDAVIEIDDEAPSVSLSVSQPKVSGTPTTVGPGTVVSVSASDGTGIGSLVVRAVQDGTEVGSRSFSRDSGDVALSDLGLEQEGNARLVATASDVAGNTGDESISLEVDASEPSLSNARTQISGSEVIAAVDASDSSGIEQVTLFHQGPQASQFTSVQMTGSQGAYEATIPCPATEGTLSYYVQASDALGNQANLGTRSSPRTADLTGCQAPSPEVTITSPADGAEVSDTLTVTVDVSTGATLDQVTIQDAGGDSQSLTLTDGSVTVDTTELDEGRAIIEATATVGEESATDQVSVTVNNRLDPCEEGPRLTEDGTLEVCVRYSPPSNASRVQMTLLRNGDTVGEGDAECQAGQCVATFSDVDEGPIEPRLTAYDEGGNVADEKVGEIQNVGGALSPSEPLGRFISVLVLSIVTVGAAAYAAFGRWS